MNREPCVRLGIRISPKIREKPADNRNNKPPNVMLLTASSSQNVMSLFRSLRRRPPCWLRPPAALSSTLQRRKIARIDRLREKLLLVISPELTHILVGLHRLVDQLAA